MECRSRRLTLLPAPAPRLTRRTLSSGPHATLGVLSVHCTIVGLRRVCVLSAVTRARSTCFTAPQAVLRVQAALGNVMAALVPRAKLVPAVRPEDMSQDAEVVSACLR